MCGGGDEIYDLKFINEVINKVLVVGRSSKCASDCVECHNNFCPDRKALRAEKITINNKQEVL